MFFFTFFHILWKKIALKLPVWLKQIMKMCSLIERKGKQKKINNNNSTCQTHNVTSFSLKKIKNTKQTFLLSKGKKDKKKLQTGDKKHFFFLHVTKHFCKCFSFHFTLLLEIRKGCRCWLYHGTNACQRWLSYILCKRYRKFE